MDKMLSVGVLAVALFVFSVYRRYWRRRYTQVTNEDVITCLVTHRTVLVRTIVKNLSYGHRDPVSFVDVQKVLAELETKGLAKHSDDGRGWVLTDEGAERVLSFA